MICKVCRELRTLWFAHTYTALQVIDIMGLWIGMALHTSRTNTEDEKCVRILETAVCMTRVDIKRKILKWMILLK
jgi:hypothetical protein